VSSCDNHEYTSMASIFMKIKMPLQLPVWTSNIKLLKICTVVLKLKHMYGQVYEQTDVTSPIYVKIIHIMQKMYNQLF
jgi:hypothetical protein